MALDEPNEDDQVFTDRDITYVMNKNLFERVKPVKVDFVRTAMGSGFHVVGNLGEPEGCCCS
jgi:Fe-S cluster assembly iron-binding protein IscA